MKTKMFQKRFLIITLVALAYLWIPQLTGQVSAQSDGTPITVDPSSYIQSGTWIHYGWGHYRIKTAPITVPGTVTAYETHGWNSSQSGHMHSWTTSTVATPEDRRLDLDATVTHQMTYGGHSFSYVVLNFSVASGTSYEISGSYNSTARMGKFFSVSLKDVANNTVVFERLDALGTLIGEDLTGALPPGDYQFRVVAASHSQGSWQWYPGVWPGYGGLQDR